jgi:hypothetical protein
MAKFQVRRSYDCFAPKYAISLPTTAAVGFAEEDYLQLVVAGQHTSTGNSAENVGACALEQGLGTLLSYDLVECIEGVLVLDGLSRGHHHTTTHGVDWVGGKAGAAKHKAYV